MAARQESQQRTGFSAEPRAILCATREFGTTPVRRRRGRSFMDLVGPGARGEPLTNAQLRRQTSVTQIEPVKSEDVIRAEALMSAIEARDLWVSEAAARAVAAMQKGTKGAADAAMERAEERNAA